MLTELHGLLKVIMVMLSYLMSQKSHSTVTVFRVNLDSDHIPFYGFIMRCTDKVFTKVVKWRLAVVEWSVFITNCKREIQKSQRQGERVPPAEVKSEWLNCYAQLNELSQQLHETVEKTGLRWLRTEACGQTRECLSSTSGILAAEHHDSDDIAMWLGSSVDHFVFKALSST